MISQVIKPKLIRSRTSKRALRRLDQWIHFHRFESRWLCDLADVSTGIPASLVRFARDAHYPAHKYCGSYHRHPSKRVSV